MVVVFWKITTPAPSDNEEYYGRMWVLRVCTHRFSGDVPANNDIHGGECSDIPHKTSLR